MRDEGGRGDDLSDDVVNGEIEVAAHNLIAFALCFIPLSRAATNGFHAVGELSSSSRSFQPTA